MEQPANILFVDPHKKSRLVAGFFNGEGGIRTLDRVAPIQHFQCCAFDHSATSPEANWQVAM